MAVVCVAAGTTPLSAAAVAQSGCEPVSTFACGAAVEEAACEGEARARVPVARASEATATVPMRVRRPREDMVSEMTTPGVMVRQDTGEVHPM